MVNYPIHLFVILFQESDNLERKNGLLQKEVYLLQSEVKELEYILDTHRCFLKIQKMK